MPVVFPHLIARRPVRYAVFAFSLLLSACSGGGGGSRAGAATLDAQAVFAAVTLSWSGGSANSYNLYYSTAPNCNIANYASCPGGTMVTGVSSPYNVSGLSNGQNYWFQLESVSGSSKVVSSEVGARPDQLVTNNTVDAIARDGNGVIYLGGDFTYAGYLSGHGVPISASSGHPGAYPVVNGAIYAAAADGSGGFYIGGDFTLVDGQTRNRLAHILADGTLDPGWSPAADNVVLALAVSGSTIYVGGAFTNITTAANGMQARHYLAAILSDGSLDLGWDPNADNAVRALAVSGTTVYAGGNFTLIGGVAYNHLVAIDATTGSADSLWVPDPDGTTVNALAVDAGTGTVYVGGDFANIAGMAQTCLAAIDTGGNLVGTFPNADKPVYALVVSSGTVYVGGNFANIGGVSHTRLAAVATNGTVSTWDPAPDNVVATLAVSGSTLYAGGDFTLAAGQTRFHLAAFASDGSLAAWDPTASSLVRALAVSGRMVYVGGDFTSVGGGARNRLAAFNADGSLGSWNPGADGTVYALLVSGSSIYVGGAFANLGGAGRNHLAVVDSSGSLGSWNPDANGNVYALAMAGGVIYAGGAFTTVAGNGRNRLAAIDSGGILDMSWDPDADGAVRALVTDGTYIYAGGDFTNLKSTTSPLARNHLAAIDTTDSVSNWNPNANGVVYSLALSGTTVYAGGIFTKIGTTNRSRLAAIGTNGMLDLNWNPGANGGVRALSLYDDGSTVTLYAGGDFTGIGSPSTTRNRLAAFDAATGSPGAWNPNVDNTVYAISASAGSVAVGGNFTTLGSVQTPNFATLAP